MQWSIQWGYAFWLFRTNESFSGDLSLLKKTVKDLFQEEASLWSYISWNGYDVEIVSILEEDKEEKMYASSAIVLQEKNKNKIENFRNEMLKIHSIFRENREIADYIRKCFLELNKAIRFPLDTGYHCYRAIELLRSYTEKKYHTLNERDSWEKFVEWTGANREKVESWKVDNLSRERHEWHKDMSKKEIDEILLMTWNIIDTFVDKEYNL